jgi:hypothetical protein
MVVSYVYRTLGLLCRYGLCYKSKSGIAGSILEWVLTVYTFVENLPEDSSTVQCMPQLYQLRINTTFTVTCVSSASRNTKVRHSAGSA